MRSKPFIILFCLFFAILDHQPLRAQFDDHLRVLVDPDRPTITSTPLNSPYAVPTPAGFSACPPGKPIRKCAPMVGSPAPCAPTACVEPPCGAAPCDEGCCILPRRMVGQCELQAQCFFANIGGTVRWPAAVFGVPTTEASLTTDLGLPSAIVLQEYTARFQFHTNWAAHYSIMTFDQNASHYPEQTIYFGGWPYSAFTMTRTKWDFVYQRVGLLYQPIVTPTAIVSVFTYWTFNDQKIALRNSGCANYCSSLDRRRQMVMSGIEIQRCIRTLPNGATLACDNRAGIGYLDDANVVDLQTGLQFMAPMNANRWGYLKGGYRSINFRETRNDLHLDARFQGWFGEMGLIF